MDQKPFRTARMMSCARFLILCSIVLAGCGTAQKVAVSSFRVIDAPARFIRDRIDPPQTTTTTTTTTETGISDVATPGRPVVSAPPPSGQRRVVTQPGANTRVETTPRPRLDTATTGPRRPAPSATPRTTASQAPQFPTAKPVLGKPGYVYSIDPKGGIVDVTGYKSGDKAKDPYTQQVFIVP